MTHWQIGVACKDITPPLFVPELGFVPRQHRFVGVHDSLFAKAVALEDAEGNAAVIVTVDAIGFHRALLGDGRDFIAEFRQRVHEATGIDPEAIMLTASHAHSTPETIGLTPVREVEGVVAWLEQLLEQLVRCAVAAWGDRQQGQALAAVGEVKGVAWSRRIVGKDGKVYRLPHRPPDKQVVWEGHDPQVGVLVFRRSDGDIVLVNFTCHPTVVQVNDLVSADYPGALTRFVEQWLPNCRACLFLQGACGDVNTVYQTTSDFDDVALYGMALAGEVVKQVALLRLHFKDRGAQSTVAQTFRRISGWRAAPLSPHLAFARQLCLLPPRSDLPDEREAEQDWRKALEQVDNAHWWLRAERTLSPDEQRQGWQVLQAWHAWQVAKRGRDERERTVEVQALILGAAALVGVSGELFVAPALRLKQQSPFSFTFVVGYANGYNGYLTTQGAWAQGGYEVSLGPWTVCGGGSGDIVADVALTLLQSLVSPS